jgi:hypothetical protein
MKIRRRTHIAIQRSAERAVRAKLLTAQQVTARELQDSTGTPMHILRMVLAGMVYRGELVTVVKPAKNKMQSNHYSLP